MEAKIYWTNEDYANKLHIKECEVQISGKFIDDFSGRYAENLVQIFFSFIGTPRPPQDEREVYIVIRSSQSVIHVNGTALGFISGRYCVDAKNFQSWPTNFLKYRNNKTLSNHQGHNARGNI